MAGREVEIHRGRLDKKILDRAQLFPRFLSKTIYKKNKNFRQTFSFFWMENLIFLKNLGKISTFFVFDPSKMTLDFSFENEKKSRFFKNFKIPIQKNENAFRKILKFLKIVFDKNLGKSCARSARIFLSNLPR